MITGLDSTVLDIGPETEHETIQSRNPACYGACMGGGDKGRKVEISNIQTICRCCLVGCVCAQSCQGLCNTMDCSLPDASVHGVFQAMILEWVAISSSRGSSRTQGSNPHLLRWQADSFPIAPPGKPLHMIHNASIKGRMHLLKAECSDETGSFLRMRSQPGFSDKGTFGLEPGK